MAEDRNMENMLNMPGMLEYLQSIPHGVTVDQLQKPMSNVGMLTMAAQMEVGRGRHLKAEMLISQAIMMQPNMPLLWNFRGIFRSEVGDTLGAIDDFSTALRIAEVSPFYTNRGQQYYRLRKLDLALRDATRAVELDPSVSDLWVNRALIHYEKHDDKKVLEDCNKAIELDASNAYAYNQRALSYIVQEKYEEAVRDCLVAIRLRNGFAEGFLTLANAHLCQNDLDRAMKDCDAVIRYSNDSIPEVYHIRGKVVFGKGGWQESLEDYDRCLKSYPKYTEALYDKANAFLAMGHCAESKAIFDSIMPEEYEERYLVSSALCVVHLCMDEPEIAHTYVVDSHKQILIKDDVVPAYLRRCMTLYHLYMGQYHEALKEIDQAVEVSKLNAAQYVVRSLVYIHLGNLDEALSNANKALASKSTNVHIWECDAAAFLVRALVFIELEDREQVLFDLRKCFEMAQYMKDSLHHHPIWRHIFGNRLYDALLQHAKDIPSGTGLAPIHNEHDVIDAIYDVANRANADEGPLDEEADEEEEDLWG